MYKSTVLWRSLTAVVFLVMLAMPKWLVAQEHPSEHPQNKAVVDVEGLVKSITNYVDEDGKMKGGMFVVYDSTVKKPLALTLTKVHRDKLSKLKDGRYFVCADFSSPDSVAYDLDFFMKQGMTAPEVTEISIHKQAGKPRYEWVEENGVWRKK